MNLDKESPVQGMFPDKQQQALSWKGQVIQSLRRLFVSPAVEYICDSPQPQEDVVLPVAFAREVKRIHSSL